MLHKLPYPFTMSGIGHNESYAEKIDYQMGFSGSCIVPLLHFQTQVYPRERG
jgi:hypothetical protein